ncbi:hypothetical protein L228DRAFT_242688 [Xylona heveae TC161]|uniref:Uncharacterized protein n=1 Tax=Xylona heveae (strain CBS 132557 / TC161) TaxID=1328760 RepID=A0A165JHH8_XYLHT|nr:hypothetical protein L228DRAFT_242688 [Xylona heveae TC161]KZF26248.1 hypothetical protein L228DRAFT_242688 [Xylona heveae TC161]
MSLHLISRLVSPLRRPAVSYFSIPRISLRRPQALPRVRRYIAPAARQRVGGYPERLLIYHSGTGKSVFIGCLKVTTIFIFGFSTLIIGPMCFQAPDVPNLVAGAIMVGGSIPILFVTYTTAPFVHYVHLQLPMFARASKDVLQRYTQHLPADAKLHFTTMRLIGTSRISTIRLSELKFAKGRAGVANLKRILSKRAQETQSPWWMGKPLTDFYVKQSEGNSRQLGIWENVLHQIRRAS